MRGNSGDGRQAGLVGRGRRVDALLVVVLAAVAVGLRAVFLRETFGSDGTVTFTDPDGFYHARRALYTFTQFPAVLFFDPYLNYPAGAPVPWPPLWDWILAAAARALGGSPRGFELTLAWAAPVVAAFTVIPVYAMGRLLGGRGTGLAAGAIFAALPVAVYYARVGNPDHHAWVALLAAVFLAHSIAALRPETRGRALIWIGAALCVLRVLVVLSWNGSLLYVAIGEGALLLGASVAGRADLLRVQAAGALAAAALAAPFVWLGGVPAAGPFATTMLSWFHVAVFAGTGFVCAALAALERRRPSGSFASRIARAVAIGAFATGVLVAFEAPRRALVPSAAFLSGRDSWSNEGNPETRALFGPPIEGAVVPRMPASAYYGWLAYALPLALAVTLWRVRRPEGRAASACFAAWAAVLGSLAVSGVRFGSDFAPAASVAFALTAGAAQGVAARRMPGGARAAAALAAAVVAAALFWPPAASLYWPQARSLWESRSDASAPWGPFASLVAFGRSVRAATPETAGYVDADGLPAYGVLVEPSLGHALRWASRRAVPADNFGPYLDALTYHRVDHFYATRSEDEAVLEANRLRTPYVVTATHTALRSGPALVQRRLHEHDGSARGHLPHLGHFRLVTEGPEHGLPFLPVAAPQELAPYKLFEVVAGAVLEVSAAPESEVEAELGLVTSAGRRFRFHAAALADGAGIARLRVPYATDAVAPTRAEGRWRVRTGDAEIEVEVSERDVVDGRVQSVGKPTSASARQPSSTTR
jgi:asparagine N-glycosylation enzyme membrane subunit Stt3